MSDEQNTPQSIEEIIERFYYWMEMYESYAGHFRTVLNNLLDTTHSEGVRNWWRKRREFYERELRNSVDQLLLLTNALRVLAQRVGTANESLAILAKSLSYKPDFVLPPNPPTDEECDEAQDDVELLRSAHVVLTPEVLKSIAPALTAKEPTGPTAPLASDAIDVDEVVGLKSKKYAILRAMLDLGAVDNVHRVMPKKVMPKLGKKAGDEADYRHEFSDLKGLGYLLPKRREHGCYLTLKGRTAAEFLVKNPQLD